MGGRLRFAARRHVRVLRRPWIDSDYRCRHGIGASAGLSAGGRDALRETVVYGLEVGLPALLRYTEPYKCVLKAAMRGLVPDVALDRSDRIGFDVPLHTWPSLIPDVADLLEADPDLPPVHAPAMRPLLGRVRRGETLSPGDALTVWRLVGLSDWASDFQVVFD